VYEECILENNLLAWSTVEKKLYVRTPGVSWSEFDPQPPVSVGPGSALLCGLPNGSIIVCDAGNWPYSAPTMWHWDPSPGTWIDRGHPGVGYPEVTTSWTVGVAVGEDSAVAIVEGNVATFDGATNTWAYLGYHAGIDDVAALSLTDIWTCGRAFNINYAWHYDGAWTDLYPITPELNRGVDAMLFAVAAVDDAVFYLSFWAFIHWAPTTQIVRFRGGIWAGTGNILTALGDIWALDPQTIWFNSEHPPGTYHIYKGSDIADGGTNTLSVAIADQQDMSVQTAPCTKPIISLNAQQIYVAGTWAGYHVWETLNGGATWALTTGYPGTSLAGLAIWTVVEAEPPVVTPVSPTDGQMEVTVSSNVIVDATDPLSGISGPATLIEEKRGGGAWVTVYQAEAAQPDYAVARSVITGGYRYEINPSVNWSYDILVQYRVTVEDLDGNQTSLVYSFSTISPPRSTISPPRTCLGFQFNLNQTQNIAIPIKQDLFGPFDDKGLMLTTERLLGEKNWEYRRRLRSVFTQKANSTYQGLINGITNGLGLALFKAISINPRVDNNGNFLAADPYVKFDESYLYLYSDYTQDLLDYQIDRLSIGGNYETLQALINLINSTTFFEAALESGVAGTTRGSAVLNQSNRVSVQEEIVPCSTKFKLQNAHIIEGSLYFSDRKIFKTEVNTPALVFSVGSYCVDYSKGIVTVRVAPGKDIRARYDYTIYPFKAIASPIVLHNITQDNYKIQLFQQILQDDGTYIHQLPTSLGVDIINELLTVGGGLYLGK